MVISIDAPFHRLAPIAVSQQRILLTRRRILLGTFALVIAAGAGCGGCRRTEPEEIGTIFQDAKMSGPADPKQGSQGAVAVQRPAGPDGVGGTATTTRNYKNCTNPVAVRKADPRTPEGTLFLAFEALLIPDEEEAFKRFYAHVNPLFQNPVDARRYWFASTRVKGGVPFQRLVYGPADPSFDVCEKRTEGEGKIRIFVGKSPPVGSNPPYLLAKVGDKWLLETFAPF